jgi:hypothetical protein
MPLRDERDDVQARMSSTVGALETIRLSLLKLHAGSLTLEGLTTHIGLAADISADVDRLVSANVEVEQMLRFRKQLVTTPA